MFRARESIEYVQDILGHSDEIMTLWYTHFADDAKRDVMNSYEQAIDRANWNELRRKKRS
jgi:integrase